MENKMENVYMTLPFYGKKMKQEGVSLPGLKLVKHFFIPNEKDLIKICDFVVDCETCVDIGSGYGKLITILSEILRNTKFLGIDTLYWVQNKFPVPKQTDNLSFEFNGLEAMAYSDLRGKEVRKFDCVLCCWMPHGSDWRKELSILSKRKVILILSKDFATGTEETYTGMQKYGFKIVNKAWTSVGSLIQLWER